MAGQGNMHIRDQLIHVSAHVDDYREELSAREVDTCLIKKNSAVFVLLF